METTKPERQRNRLASRRIRLGTGEVRKVLGRAKKLLTAADYQKLRAVVDTLESMTRLLEEQSAPGAQTVTKGKIKRV